VVAREPRVQLIVQRAVAARVRQGIEPAVEATGNRDEQVPRRCRERIADRMGAVPGQARDTARLEDLESVADPDLDRALDDVPDLILATVHVQPVPGPRVERRFEDVARAAGL